MKSASDLVVVLVTAPTLTNARTLVRAALELRLIACANIVPKIESHYRWRGRMECSNEVLLVLKSRKPLLTRLKSVILQLHPYDTPEFVAIPLTGGSQRYFDWLRSETA